jgi:hypothetical protein
MAGYSKFTSVAGIAGSKTSFFTVLIRPHGVTSSDDSLSGFVLLLSHVKYFGSLMEHQKIKALISRANHNRRKHKSRRDCRVKCDDIFVSLDFLNCIVL